MATSTPDLRRPISQDTMSPTTTSHISTSFISTSPPISTDPPTLITLPRELRDRILQDVLLNPVRPDFEAKTQPVETKFKKYFAIGFVNKQLHYEAKEVLISSRELVIISSSWEGFKQGLEDGAIPIVSDHHIRLIGFHAMRVHVQFLTTKTKVVQSVALLANDLPDVSYVLRGLSLDLPHPDLHDFMHPEQRPQFHQISMRIQFGGVTVPRNDQIRLLRCLKRANSIGMIKILKINDPAVTEILPGFDCSLPEVDDVKKLYEPYTKLIVMDGDGYLAISKWQFDLATKAHRAKNYELAELRYGEVIRFLQDCETYNHDVRAPQLKYGAWFDKTLFLAGVSLASCLTHLGKWHDARHNIDHVLNGIPKENRPPNDVVQQAFEVKKWIDEHMPRKGNGCNVLDREHRHMGCRSY